MCVVVQSVDYVVVLNILVTLEQGNLLRLEVDLRSESVLHLLLFSLYTQLLKSLILLFLNGADTLMNGHLAPVFVLVDYLRLGPAGCRVRSCCSKIRLEAAFLHHDHLLLSLESLSLLTLQIGFMQQALLDRQVHSGVCSP